MLRIDVKGELKHIYQPSAKEPTIVDIPEMNFLTVDGAGDPNTAPEYRDALQALYSMAYALKFMVKKSESAIDYGVLPLEGFWWSDDVADFVKGNKGKWKWTAMIMQPKYVTADMFKKAIEQVGKRKDLPSLGKIRFESFHEGLSAQILYFGPYSEEGPTIERLHGFIKASGYQPKGKHHEIYLNDPQRSVPEKLKTIIRQPVEKGK